MIASHFETIAKRDAFARERGQAGCAQNNADHRHAHEFGSKAQCELRLTTM
jgi:hypothetical protein